MNTKVGRPASWDKEQLANALYHYFNTEHGLDITSRKFGIPKTTLYRYVKKEKKYRSERSEPRSESSERQSGGKVKLDPGRSLGQFHAYQAEKYRGQTYLKIAFGILVGLFIQEIVQRKTGDTIFGWLAGQPKVKPTNQRNVRSVLPSTTNRYFKAEPLPQVSGYDINEFK